MSHGAYEPTAVESHNQLTHAMQELLRNRVTQLGKGTKSMVSTTPEGLESKRKRRGKVLCRLQVYLQIGSAGSGKRETAGPALLLRGREQ